jgi:hypothetical protein
MSTLTINRLTDSVGAEVNGLDAERFWNDESLPDLIGEALEESGVLVFPELGLDAAAQVPFGERLGDVQFWQDERTPEPGVMRVSLDSTKTSATTLRGAALGCPVSSYRDRPDRAASGGGGVSSGSTPAGETSTGPYTTCRTCRRATRCGSPCGERHVRGIRVIEDRRLRRGRLQGAAPAEGAWDGQAGSSGRDRDDRSVAEQVRRRVDPTPACSTAARCVSGMVSTVDPPCTTAISSANSSAT